MALYIVGRIASALPQAAVRAAVGRTLVVPRGGHVRAHLRSTLRAPRNTAVGSATTAFGRAREAVGTQVVLVRRHTEQPRARVLVEREVQGRCARARPRGMHELIRHGAGHHSAGRIRQVPLLRTGFKAQLGDRGALDVPPVYVSVHWVAGVGAHDDVVEVVHSGACAGLDAERRRRLRPRGAPDLHLGDAEGGGAGTGLVVKQHIAPHLRRLASEGAPRTAGSTGHVGDGASGQKRPCRGLRRIRGDVHRQTGRHAEHPDFVDNASSAEVQPHPSHVEVGDIGRAGGGGRQIVHAIGVGVAIARRAENVKPLHLVRFPLDHPLVAIFAVCAQHARVVVRRTLHCGEVLLVIPHNQCERRRSVDGDSPRQWHVDLRGRVHARVLRRRHLGLRCGNVRAE
mmetsp:Transcript_111757/g.323027  ORF Transcript_111757/g.323027 Transcript_111757/m.323027 type:complete len:399 (+) Transcript_111757:1064-2260(+)